MKSNIFILTFLTALFITIGNHQSDGSGTGIGIGASGTELHLQPEFAEPIENVTVPLGRDAIFTCRVRGLGGYRVGWVRADSKGILSIGHTVITHNPSIKVSHSSDLWHLHIKGVKEEDRGSYMCQINTSPMLSMVGYLSVVIPPDFIPEETSGDIMVPEGSPVKLTCNARGHPNPKISFRREGNQNITYYKPGGMKSQVPVFEGNVLKLVKISRSDMGPYLCIASNSVPPSISKRIFVSVNFPPALEIVNQLIASPIGSNVVLECNVEAFPRSIHFWMRENSGSGGTMIISGDRYEVQELAKSIFEVKMVLIIKRYRRSDAGNYHCVAKNSLGEVDSIIKLQVLQTESSKPSNDLGRVRQNKNRKLKNKNLSSSNDKSLVYEREDYADYDDDEDEENSDEDSDEEILNQSKQNGRNKSKFPQSSNKPYFVEKTHENSNNKASNSKDQDQKLRQNSKNSVKSINSNKSNGVQTIIVPVNNRGSRDFSSSGGTRRVGHLGASSVFYLKPTFYITFVLFYILS